MAANTINCKFSLKPAHEMDNKKLEEVYTRLNNLIDKQSGIQAEIETIKRELDHIKNATAVEENAKTPDTEPNNKYFETAPVVLGTISPSTVDLKANKTFAAPIESDNLSSESPIPPTKRSTKSIFETVDFERFIGENLLNKIGILVLIIGVGIGVKYAIDRDLVSPIVRVISGYGVGIALLLTAIYLKARYHDFSAVLLSGAMAVFYFITFAANSFYGLISQLPAFGIMVFFTLFTVFASVRYNRQIIAHLGLVGAYAVPFLLNKEPGNLTIFFSYIALLNFGILALAFQRSWKNLFYSAFAFTWLIVISWRFTSYTILNANLALFFGSLFFIIFYAIFLAQKLLKKEALTKADLYLIIANALIYFGLGFSILIKKFPNQNEVLSFFTIINAVVHLSIAALLFVRRQAHKGLFRLVAGLAITFLTIVIPIQLSGYWVTLLWAVEAALILWLSKKEKDKTFENFSFVLIAIAIGGFMWDWQFERSYYLHEAFLNSRFLSNILFTLCFGFMLWLISKSKVDFSAPDFGTLRKAFYLIIPAIVLITSFLAFSIEVQSYFSKLQKEISVSGNSYKIVRAIFENYNLTWQINLLMFFTIFWSAVNHIKIKNKHFGTFLFFLGIVSIFIFVTKGFEVLEFLRETYLNNQLAEEQNKVFTVNKSDLLMRYVGYGFVASLLLMMKKINIIDDFPIRKKTIWEFCLIGTLIAITSSELINIAALTGAYNAHQMGLTILWAICSLVLIALGILWNRKDFRIAAIILFGIVLVKLFFYDLVELETIPKTIVFVLIGILLLIISFLYNKFKGRLYNE